MLNYAIRHQTSDVTKGITRAQGRGHRYLWPRWLVGEADVCQGLDLPASH